MKTLSHQLKPLFIEAVHAAFPELPEGELLELVTVDEPREMAHGDYACPVAFKLSKRLGSAPQAIAQAIVEHFPKDHRVGSVEFAAPAFVNLRLAPDFLEEGLKQLEAGFSVQRPDERRRPVIVEYPSTNAAKEMGAHHIITTTLGDALANLFDFMGEEVVRIDHFGDWGTHFGKVIYAVQTWGDTATIHEHPNAEFSRLYVQFNEAAEQDPALEDEARRIFKELEAGNAEYHELWEWIVAESKADTYRILKRMGVELDHTIGESFYSDKMPSIIDQGVEKGVFVEGEKGSLIFDMGPDQGPALIRKGDGATLYLTRDLAAVRYRSETWNAAVSLYVVDHAQSLHFKQNFAIAEALGLAPETQLEHVSFGRMRFKDGSMSTRKGNTIKLNNLLDEAARRAAELAAERGSELPRAELAAMAETVGVSSLKYGVLSQDRNKDVIFDWDKIISLEGNSAPYLLYSYARAKRIVDKMDTDLLRGLPKLTEDAELVVLRRMIKFPEVLERAVAERKPHMICTFLYELCQEFNRFYGHCRVADADTEAQRRTRLGLVLAFMHQMKAGLGILGIPVVERM